MFKRVFYNKKHLFFSAALALLISPFANSETIAVIVNPTSPLTQSDVTVKILQDIFLGKTTEVKGHALQPIAQEQQRPIAVLFNQTVLGKSESQVRSYWAKMVFSGGVSPPPSLSDDQSVKLHVAKNNEAISYIQKSQVDSTVKVIFEATP